MNENLQFLQAFLKNPLKVGAITPSSPELARKMLEDVKPDAENVILELGVGTGAITKFIEEIVPDERSYFGLELNPDLAKSNHEKFPGLEIICGSACDMGAIYRESGFGKVSYIISCLPFVSLPSSVSEKIYQQIEEFMEAGCMFRTFQYAHGYYTPAALKLREFMRDRYGKSKRSRLVVKNVPPAYVLTWSTI
jgi:phospholipid N-methyltransferase